jgi:hypothetical protein
MPDLAERIRSYVDTAQPPVSLEDVKSTVDRHQYKGRRSRVEHGRRPLLAGAVAAAAIVALVAVLVGVFGKGNGGEHARSVNLAMAPASVVLHSLATIADEQSPLVPGPGQYLYVRVLGASETNGFAPPSDGIVQSPTEGQKGFWTYYEQYVRQTWTSPTGPNATSTSTVGVPQFMTNADQEAWKAAGSPPFSAPVPGGNLPNPYYDVTDLPTNPSKITAYMASQPGLPAGNLSSDPVWQFDEASEYIGAGASSGQRAALYSFMATLPGVVNYGPVTTLGTALSGIAIGIPGHDGERAEAVINTETSNILELRVVVVDPAQYPKGLSGGWQVKSGEAINYYDYVSTGVADSNTASPADDPPLPTPWPYGTSRQPASTVAYPGL